MDNLVIVLIAVALGLYVWAWRLSRGKQPQEQSSSEPVRGGAALQRHAALRRLDQLNSWAMESLLSVDGPSASSQQELETKLDAARRIVNDFPVVRMFDTDEISRFIAEMVAQVPELAVSREETVFFPTSEPN